MAPDTLVEGKPLGKLGYKGLKTSSLTLDGCRVDGDALVGGVAGHGFAQVMSGLEVGRINVAARAVGVARAALEDSLAYAQERVTFGQPIVEHQAIAHKLADMATDIEAARWLYLAAARKKDARRARRSRGGDGQAVRLRDVHARHARRHRDPRRLRLHRRVRRRALLPRRAAVHASAKAPTRSCAR